MFGKNRNKKVGLCVMVVTVSLVLAAVWAVLATPETALAKKPGGGGGGGKETRTYRVTFQGDLENVAAIGCRTMSIINPEDSVAHLLFNIVGPIDLSGVIGGVADFDTCFPEGAFDTGIHGLFRDKHDPAKINSIFFFPGLDKRGKEIHYRIDFTGTVDPTTWTPAAVGDSARISLDTWELKADTGGRKSACSGDGVFSGSSISGRTGIPITTILVDRISESECP